MKGTEKLKRGKWVVVFPEGTRTAAGSRQKYQPGGGMLASKSGYPVLPVAHNSGYFWPRQSFIKHPGTIDMHIGAAIRTEGKSAKQITRECEDWIEAEVDKLPAPQIAL